MIMQIKKKNQSLKHTNCINSCKYLNTKFIKLSQNELKTREPFVFKRKLFSSEKMVSDVC